jgi:hypothetical protein
MIRTIRWTFSAAFGAAFFFCLSFSSHAAVILTVDATNPSAVVFTATGGAASANSSGTGYGLLLHGPMATDGNVSLNVPNLAFGPFKPFVSGVPYNNIGDEGDAIRFFVAGNQFQTFTAGTTAFTDSITANLSFLDFVHTNLTGDIEIRNNSGQATGVIIGQFEFTGPEAVVPEPSSLAIAGIGFSGLLVRRRRNR